MRIDWRKFLAQHDLVYEMQAKVWQDGMGLGNGSLSALAYEPFHPEWTINKNDVWDYRHAKFKRYSVAELRQLAATGADPVTELGKESALDEGLYPCPKTCGQLRIRFGMNSIYAPGHRITKRLRLHDATLHTQLDKHLSHPRVSSFVCAERNVLVIRSRDVSAMTAFGNHVDLYRVADAQLPPVQKGAQGDTIWLEQNFPDGFRYVLMARVVPRGRSAYRELFKQTVQKKWWYVIEPSKKIESRRDGEYAVVPVCGDFDVFVTVVTSRDAKAPLAAARRTLTQAVRAGADKLHADHRRWWAKFWTKSYVGLSDPVLEQLWYVSLYNLGSALRGTPVGGLCGPWFGPMDTPSQVLPWRGYYTNDYNAQAPVMPVFRINHPELADGTFRTLLGQLPQARRNARELYEVPGAHFPLATDPSGAEITCGQHRLIQTSGPYWGVFLWWHYLYTKDVDYLKKIGYPILRAVATFFTHYMTWHPDEGRYHLEISQQPELTYIRYDDPIDTLVKLKYTLQATIQAARVLGGDGPLVDRCRHVLEHYPDYPHNTREILGLRGMPPNHWSQRCILGGLFPCGEFDPEIAPEWRRLCRVEIKKMVFWSKMYGCNQGRLQGSSGSVCTEGLLACWSGWTSLAWNYLEDMLKTVVKPNGLIAHNMAVLADSRLSERNIKHIPDAEIHHDLDPEPFTAAEVLNGRTAECTTENLDCRDTIFPALEGPATYLLLLGEMLLQSHNGILRLFPCLPAEQDAEFHDLRAQGPTLVSAARQRGKVRFLRLQARAAVEWKVRNPWPGQTVYFQSSRSRRTRTESAGKYLSLDLARGEEVVLADRAVNLALPGQMRPRAGAEAKPRCKLFSDGMVVWLGKPQPSVYYASLETARGGGAGSTRGTQTGAHHQRRAAP